MISPIARAALKAIEEDTVQVPFLDRVDGVAHPAVAAALLGAAARAAAPSRRGRTRKTSKDPPAAGRRDSRRGRVSEDI
jgi:hypothetical protein